MRESPHPATPGHPSRARRSALMAALSARVTPCNRIWSISTTPSLPPLAREPVTKAPGLTPGLDDVSAVCEPVDDRLCQPRIGKDLGPLAEGQVGGDDQRAALVAFADHLK